MFGNSHIRWILPSCGHFGGMFIQAKVEPVHIRLVFGTDLQPLKALLPAKATCPRREDPLRQLRGQPVKGGNLNNVVCRTFTYAGRHDNFCLILL